VKSLKPDIVLLDSQISGIGEQSLLESLKGDENYRQLRVIAFFSGSEKEFLQKFSSFKPDGLLRKPFDSRDLKEVVFSVLDEEPTLIKTKTIKTSATQTIVLEEESAPDEPTKSTVVTSSPSESEPSAAPIAIEQLSSEELKELARVEIQKWIQENLSVVAEGLLKAEIERIVSSK
jgi:DNA-binding NarL/FixJ family response regulator